MLDTKEYDVIEILPRWCYTDEEFVKLMDSIDLVKNKIFYAQILIEPDDKIINELLDI